MPVTEQLSAAEGAYRAFTDSLLDELDGQDLATLGRVAGHLDSMVLALYAVASRAREQAHGNAVAAGSAQRSDQTAELNEAADYLRHLEHLLEAGALLAGKGAHHLARADRAG